MAEDSLPSSPSVPKFSSFRAAGIGRSSSHGHKDLPSRERRGSNDHRDVEASHRSDAGKGFTSRHRRKRDDERHRSQKRPRLDSTTEVVSADSVTHGTEPVTVSWEVLPDSFCVDTLGDPHNLTYGTIHRYNIPPFYRWGFGYVLGLPSRCRIDKQSRDDGCLTVRDSSENLSKAREKYAFARNFRSAEKKVRIRPSHGKDVFSGQNQDFVSLVSSRKSQKAESQPSSSLSSEAEDDRHYRSIEGRAKQKAIPADDDLFFESQSSASDYETMHVDQAADMVRQRGIDLSNSVEREPANVEAWLALINHQDDFLKRSAANITRLTAAEKRSTADIKISMYEKALAKVSAVSDGHERLIVGLMDEGAKIWETKQLAARWRDVLRDHPTSTGLWTKYLDFQQANFSAFTYEAVRESFLQCLKTLRPARLSRGSTATALDQGSETLAFLLLRCTLFMRQAGFEENATAMWQGLLECNFFAPSNLLKEELSSDEALMSSLEAFWDSEAARIGEPAAEGFNTFVAKTSDAPLPAPRVDPPIPSFDDDDFDQTWLDAEDMLTRSATYPARTSDETNDDDPYRVILFSDIKEFMVLFPSPQGRTCLLNAFLVFSRLPAYDATLGSSAFRGWWGDPFTMGTAMAQNEGSALLINRRAQKLSDVAWLAGMEPDNHYGITDPDLFNFPYRNFAVSTDTLFPQTNRWYSAVEPRDPESTQPSWILQALKALAFSPDLGPTFAEYYLAIAHQISPANARKSAKSLLKRYPSSLRLYNAFALIEWRSSSGSSTSAEKVMATALSMSDSFGAAERKEEILIWRTWVWELVDAGRDEDALHKLLSVGDGKLIGMELLGKKGKRSVDVAKDHPLMVLKARRTLEASLHASLSSNEPHHTSISTDLLSLLSYLTNPTPENLSAALLIYSNTSSALLSHPSYTPSSTFSFELELLHQSRARLLYHHVRTQTSYRPALIRDTLKQSITLFPHNTIFLTLFAWNEARFRIDDQVRTVLRDIVLPASSTNVIGWLFAVWFEVHGAPGRGHNASSIKAVLNRALETPGVASSPVLHALNVAHALRMLREEKNKKGGEQTARREQARAQVDRAIRACPWVKESYLFPLRHAEELGIGKEECRALWEVLGEKGLRVRVVRE
ncbi:MAG: hypothetical protein M1817_001082 [Caeruleum heppii]|nr:MAG: hypothetical protein M1817_001082 [Caeruleum heppii]